MGEPTLHPQLIEILDFGASKNIKTDLVMVWIEDHIFMNTYKYFEAVLKEMHSRKVNCLY